LLDQIRYVIRLKHYSYRTEQTYVQWIRRYILFHNKQHPKDMGVPEIETFLTYLATTENVAVSTQNQAFSALLFLYRHVLDIELDDRIDALRARTSRYIPTVLTPEETKDVIKRMSERCQNQVLRGFRLRQLQAKPCTTMIYTHVMHRGGRGVISPLDEVLFGNRFEINSQIKAVGLITHCITHQPDRINRLQNCLGIFGEFLQGQITTGRHFIHIHIDLSI
jgi:integrase